MGLKGMTSNPSIFEKAISHGTEYDAGHQALRLRRFRSRHDLSGRLSVRDIQIAADACAPSTTRVTEWMAISDEVSPYLAYDTAASVAEAPRPLREIGRRT